ncbi:DUF1345 domain-containing protein [uncultured Pseudacidovorax sp.]|uniref:DUF1345 domain-containing protein n=1 Tax=uncultured Pseudacidovorax sp. TaxID=679313 RepID=UPI0025EF39B1|nr:DUF1345 domain-containing protein [uncultured Pseudacidovorax sp.]
MRRHFRHVNGTQRLTYGGLAGVAVAGLCIAGGMAARPAGLLGWCAAVAAYLGWAVWQARIFDAAQVKARARSLDPPGPIILAIVSAAILSSVIAIGLLLQQVKQLGGVERGAHIVLGMVALAGSWLMIHTVYAFHYAHRYYRDDGTPDEGGLDFPGKADPDYADFMYYAFVVGMTSQVSDVQVTTREMRRLTLMHSVLSFGFNMVVLALSINVAAGVIQ